MDRLIRAGQIIRSFFSSASPGLIQSFRSDEMAAKISEILKSQEFNVIQVDFTQMAGYLPAGCKIPSVLVEHDIMFKKYQRVFRVSKSPLVKLQALIDYYKVREFELGVCRKYDKIIGMSDDDKDLLQQFIPGLDVSVIPNGVDTAYFEPSGESRDLSKILFVGGMKNSPNLDAVNYFCEQMLPLIKKEIPSTRFWIMGKETDQALQPLLNDGEVKVAGYVDDIRPHLANCGVFVVPLRIAGGTRLKILEAMAAGCAVVSTSVGAEGLEVSDGKNILIADTPKEFVRAVVEVIDNADRQKRLGANARELVDSKYDWEAIASVHDDLYRSMARKEKIKRGKMVCLS